MTTSVSDLLFQAAECSKAQDYEGAAKVFDEIIRLAPTAAMPLLSRATCLLQMKKWEPALRDAQKILTLRDVPIDPNIVPGCTRMHSAACYRAAKALRELGRLEECQGMMERQKGIEEKRGGGLGSDDEDEEDIRLERQRRQPSSGRKPSGEVEGCEGGGDEIPSDASAEQMRELGNRRYSKGDFLGAVSAYRVGLDAALKVSGNDAAATAVVLHSNLAQALLRLERVDEAIRHAEECIQLDAKFPKGHFRLGCARLAQHKPVGALEAFKNAQRCTAEKHLPEDKALLSTITELEAALAKSRGT